MSAQSAAYLTDSSSRSQAPPELHAVQPESGQVGTVATLSGAGFGPWQACGQVRFHSIAARITSWTDTQIRCVVPVVPCMNISYDLTVTVAAGVSNPIPFVIEGSRSSAGPFRLRGLPARPIPEEGRLRLVAESPTGFAVLALNHSELPGAPAAAVTAVTVRNKRRARYVISIQPAISGDKSQFLLAPGGTRIFHLTLKRGENMTISADASFSAVPSSERDSQLLAVLGMELVWRACLQTDMPQMAAEFAAAHADARDSLGLVTLGMAVAKGDLYAIRECLDSIASDPAIHTRFTDVGLGSPDLIWNGNNPTTVLSVLEALRAQLTAAMSHPSDKVILRAT